MKNKKQRKRFTKAHLRNSSVHIFLLTSWKPPGFLLSSFTLILSHNHSYPSNDHSCLPRSGKPLKTLPLKLFILSINLPHLPKIKVLLGLVQIPIRHNVVCGWGHLHPINHIHPRLLGYRTSGGTFPRSQYSIILNSSTATRCRRRVLNRNVTVVKKALCGR